MSKYGSIMPGSFTKLVEKSDVFLMLWSPFSFDKSGEINSAIIEELKGFRQIFERIHFIPIFISNTDNEPFLKFMEKPIGTEETSIGPNVREYWKRTIIHMQIDSDYTPEKLYNDSVSIFHSIINSVTSPFQFRSHFKRFFINDEHDDINDTIAFRHGGLFFNVTSLITYADILKLALECSRVNCFTTLADPYKVEYFFEGKDKKANLNWLEYLNAQTPEKKRLYGTDFKAKRIIIGNSGNDSNNAIARQYFNTLKAEQINTFQEAHKNVDLFFIGRDQLINLIAEETGSNLIYDFAMFDEELFIRSGKFNQSTEPNRIEVIQLSQTSDISKCYLEYRFVSALRRKLEYNAEAFLNKIQINGILDDLKREKRS